MKGVGMSGESHPEGVGGGTPWWWRTVAGQSTWAEFTGRLSLVHRGAQAPGQGLSSPPPRCASRIQMAAALQGLEAGSFTLDTARLNRL